MVSNINDDLDKKTAANEFIDDLKNQIETQKKHFSIADNLGVLSTSNNNEQNSNKSIAIGSESSNEDDCTIIDD